jgi:hypothetical protein
VRFYVRRCRASGEGADRSVERAVAFDEEAADLDIPADHGHPRPLRALRSWRQRVWSPRPEDRAYVALERRLRDELAARRPAGQNWQDTAARLVDNEAEWRRLLAGFAE